MCDSCGNCKYMKFTKGFFYPYKCLKNKSRISEQEHDWKIYHGYKCEYFKSVFEKEDEKNERPDI